MHTVKVLAEGREYSGIFSGESLLEFINTKTPFSLPAPCGGKGRCGKCRVRAIGEVSAPVKEELKAIAQRDLERGTRLACMTRPLGGVTVTLDEKKHSAGNKAALFTDIPFSGTDLVKDFLKLPPPSIEDQLGDMERVLRAAGSLRFPLSVLRQLPEALRKCDFQFTLCRRGDIAIAAEAGDTRGKLYGLAIDIGTTTLAVYLADFSTGKNIAVMSDLNAQEVFGADVISRIAYTLNDAANTRLLAAKITQQINELCQALARQSGISPADIYLVTLAGNTTMMHLALGLPPGNIAAAPFIPLLAGPLVIAAENLNISIAPGGLVESLPSISAYVGADITAAVLACNMDTDDDANLLVDIGTNGEIVLGGRGGFAACSTAAGPAFEGAHISGGLGGIPGAINSAGIKDGRLCLTTIAEEAPRGICGSGIVDVLALLLDAGIVDGTGRMLTRVQADSLEKAGNSLCENIIDYGGEPAFVLVPEEQSASGGAILLTQKDVREIQLAKAAIAAGIDTLMRRRGMMAGDIANLYLAGGFGSYIHKESAIRIGLLPRELADKIKVVGNAAGKGALIHLLSAEARERCSKICAATDYVELSASPEFMDSYVEKMSFGD